MTEALIEIASGALSASINPLGAELWWLRDGAGRDLMTDADPAYWTGHAPLLFPIIGELNGGRYRLDGQDYHLPRHGFARRQPWQVAEQSSARVRFRLVDNEETRAVYPFAFTLDAEFALDGARLRMTISATNASERDMPASLGFHPAFAWPLPYGAARGDHRILFDTAEPEPLKLLDAGGLVAADRPTPVEGRVLPLDDALFAQDALIWEGLASKGLRYGPQDGPALRVTWSENMPNLGLWMKPGARYLCIEPWAGIADPAGFAGDIWEKPGIARIAPGTTTSWSMQVALLGV